MRTSEKRIAANRENARKSTGPSDTKSTRYNATKHGLLAKGITELDDADGYQVQLRELMNDKRPVGTVEIFLVKSAALEITRMHRAQRLEAEYITSVLNPPVVSHPLDFDEQTFEVVQDPGLPAAVDAEAGQKLVNIFQRYESVLLSRLFKTLHELERLQRMRKGESIPAPVALDVSIGTNSTHPMPASAVLETKTKSLAGKEGSNHGADDHPTTNTECTEASEPTVEIATPNEEILRNEANKSHVFSESLQTVPGPG